MGIKDPFDDKAQELGKQAQQEKRGTQDQASKRTEQAQDEARRADREAQDRFDQDYDA
ncbi:hypothetical protein ACH427_31115 [Streptomyces sp. NPDC020379]|uniref:hypothetical protein n=1 Tax=Streptomyces sp. NPDC020379 TaxID=3365071 RepID=UPI003787ED46